MNDREILIVVRFHGKFGKDPWPQTPRQVDAGRLREHYSILGAYKTGKEASDAIKWDKMEFDATCVDCVGPRHWVFYEKFALGNPHAKTK